MKSKRYWIRQKVKQLVDSGIDITRAQLEAQQMARRLRARDRLKEAKMAKAKEEDNVINDSKKGTDAPARADAGLRHESSGKESGGDAKGASESKAERVLSKKGRADNRKRDGKPVSGKSRSK